MALGCGAGRLFKRGGGKRGAGGVSYLGKGGATHGAAKAVARQLACEEDQRWGKPAARGSAPVSAEEGRGKGEAGVVL